ncbi:MAG: alginate export family protein [Bryobacteraceae bacterium]
MESWQWFTPDSGDPSYTYLGNQIRLGLSQNRENLDWMFELQAPVLLGLPDDAVAPGVQGQLGQGPAYWAANGRRSNVGMVYPKQAFVRFKNLWGKPTDSLRVGRFEFQDGGEVAAKNATLGVIKRDRVQQRLIGPFAFTHVMRSFDGFHYVHNEPKINYTVIGALPTRGVFQVDGWGWMKTAFAYASATGQVAPGKPSTGEWRVFGIYYSDWRDALKSDNRSAALRGADHDAVRIGTFGGHYVHVAETKSGTFDVMALGAGQFGKWGTMDHRAVMVDAEAGWQPKVFRRLKPWLRAGYYFGSGDGNASDNTHGTFFQMLPTVRPYARFPFFDMMNNEDRFAMLTVRPHARLNVKSEFHALRLASAQDQWYLGGGVFQPWTFGYQARPSNGAKGLANLWDVSVDVTVNPRTSLTFYYGYAQGKTVIEKIYPKGKDGHLGYIEFNYRF